MKKLIIAIVMVAVLMPSASLVFAQKSDTIVFIPKSTDVTYWLFLRKGAADKAKELGYKVDYQGVARESEIAGQVNLVRNVVSSKPAGILMAATDAKALVPPVEEGIEEGVPIIMVDSGVDSDAPYASITTDNYDGAYQAGKLLAEMIGGKGKVINLGITAGSETGIQRSQGFIDAIEEFPDITLLPVQWTMAEAANAMNITSDLLTSNPDVNGIFSAAAPIAVGAAQALKARGRDKEVKLVTFDPSPEVLPLFEEGVIHAIIAQDPYQMGYRGVEMLDKVIKGGTIEDKKIQIPVAIITPENYDTPETQKLLQTPDKF
ncbi:substrate-binding domain-containing protein [candidate division KSB3 bacterium]|jgi:ribose transport system substrate-binding protein|uniref:Substrate-binding domain-containing protein n=1 Tax=candidate division KSB3 bacterium TaxID=2044937 RepID=A0A9D5Q582_9BACT|nr:substrate-binding domain-containing protein [candidate division KSB3 bacterium]MBD3324043.1 substrate-binding domain-containing protein [candidate division KSB3 bacterium]